MSTLLFNLFDNVLKGMYNKLNNQREVSTITLGDFIRQYREDHSMSMDTFATKSGISKAYISLLEKNRHPKTGKPITPSIPVIKQAADAMGVDFDKLFANIEGGVDLSLTSNQNREEKKQPDMSTLFPNIHPIKKRTFPLFDGIAAGEPRLISDGIEVYIEATTDIKADYVLKVHGDSMIGARIHDGDLVFIRQQPEVENGEIAAVAIGNEATLKRVYYYKDKCLMILKAENPVFEDMIFQDQELEDVRILGKAVAFQSDVR